MREATKKSRKESELNTVDSQIRGLETRLKYAKSDMESTVGTDKFTNVNLKKKLLIIHKIILATLKPRGEQINEKTVLL